MISLIKIAWRNLWRNKRRTLITTSSVIIAVILSIFTRSMQLGSYDNMISNSVKYSSGHIQISGNGYWEKKSLNKSIKYDSDLLSKIKKTKPELIVPRVESFVLCSSGEHTKGVAVVGINPDIQDSLAQLSTRMQKGKYLTNNSQDILIGDKLANFLNVDVGDSLVLLGQGLHGVTAAGLFRIGGIFHFPIPEANSNLIFMALQNAQNLFAIEGKVTTLALMFPKGADILLHQRELIELLGSDYEVLNWEFTNEEIVQMIETDNAGGIFMLAIIYLIIGFGIFGTILMMTLERRKEFAIMIAVGMKRRILQIILVWETVFLTLLGLVAGSAISFPIVYYFYLNPIPLTGELAKAIEDFGAEAIMPFSINPAIFINQTITVLVIAFIVALYPIFKIGKLNILNAMRN